MFKDDLNALVDPDWPKASTPLQRAPDRAPITAVRAKSGQVSSAPSESAESEIGDEVFTEQSRETVTYTVTSDTDPTLEIDVEAITRVVMLSADNRTLDLNFTAPDAE